MAITIAIPRRKAIINKAMSAVYALAFVSAVLYRVLNSVPNQALAILLLAISIPVVMCILILRSEAQTYSVTFDDDARMLVVRAVKLVNREIEVAIPYNELNFKCSKQRGFHYSTRNVVEIVGSSSVSVSIVSGANWSVGKVNEISQLLKGRSSSTTGSSI